jgi:hypothetical protein
MDSSGVWRTIVHSSEKCKHLLTISARTVSSERILLDGDTEEQKLMQ